MGWNVPWKMNNKKEKSVYMRKRATEKSNEETERDNPSVTIRE
jgi:hypothetical protein